MSGFTHESPSAETVEWYTPPEIFDALQLRFDLDPCSPPGGAPWVPAERYVSAAEDGLSVPWEGRVWLNPPYGSLTAPFLDRLALHGEGVALVFARTDTAWGQRALRRADAVCFISGRIRFLRPDGTRGGAPGAGSMLLGYGDCAPAVAACRLGTTYAIDADLSGIQGHLMIEEAA